MGRSLTELKAPTAVKVGEMLRRCNASGLAVLIYCTYRSPEEQAIEYAKGRTTPGPIVTNAKPGESNHQKRIAFDCVPAYRAENSSVAGKLDWTPFESAGNEWAFHSLVREGNRQSALYMLDRDWRIMVEAALDSGLRWSGFWRAPETPDVIVTKPTLIEYVHFEDP